MILHTRCRNPINIVRFSHSGRLMRLRPAASALRRIISAPKIGSLLGINDRYFHGSSFFFRGPVFISGLFSLVLPIKPYWFLLACPHPFSEHHIGTLAPNSSLFAFPVPNLKGILHHWLSRRCGDGGNQPLLKSLLKHWVSDT